MVMWGAHSHPQAGSPAASSDNGTRSLQLGSPGQETVPQGSARMRQTWPGQQVGREDGLQQHSSYHPRDTSRVGSWGYQAASTHFLIGGSSKGRGVGVYLPTTWSPACHASIRG